MSVVDLVMPKLGEGIIEATIIKWHKQPGDAIKEDEVVLDIATDKVDSEVPSTAEGIIEEIYFKENDVVPIGAVLAKIKVGTNYTVTEFPSSTQPSKPIYEEASLAEDVPYQPSHVIFESKPIDTIKAKFYSPLVLNIAASENVSMSELENIPGTGQDGRVSKKDILNYISGKRNSGSTNASYAVENSQPLGNNHQPAHAPVVQQPTNNNAQVATVYQTGNTEIIEMDRMRKLIAKNMVDSLHTSAHVTSFAECDVTNLVMWREKKKHDYERREGEKITYTPLFIEAVVKSIKKYPLLSSSIEGDKIIIKRDLNIGMATALPNGNLIVPVIKNADQLNLSGLTKKVNSLANAARSGTLRPDDTTGGTFTLTNIGTFGSIMGAPIIHQPQVAIMAVGVIKKRPVVVEAPQGDSIAIRHIMYISLSYDHRIIDGALGSTFLNAVVKELESFDINRNI
ncbi:MAG TPA: dihydrolipoamide acetyltransferase family protein [Ferruginibacter sp.]|jgi:2-oxoglutarate dehydrogenase E2 component (dihydrolipoamide succinyltransferase)|nr:dihydrolipoamide acetyltransferase family protein [Ferruginibacter sp.]